MHFRPGCPGNAETLGAGWNAGLKAAAPSTFGLAPRYWRNKLLDVATAASNGLEPAAGEANPADTTALGLAHPLDERTPLLRHLVIDVADQEHRHRNARDRVEILIALVTLATILVVAASLT